MDELETDTLHVKPPEQRQSELGIVNLERHLQEAEPFAPDVIDPEHVQHHEYVQALRDLRRDQMKFLYAHAYGTEKEDSTVHANAEVIRTKMFSPLGWSALRSLEDPHSWEPEISPSQRRVATQSVEGLLDAVDTLIAKEMITTFRSLPALRRVWGAERTEDYINDMVEREPSEILTHIDELEAYMGQERTTGTVQKAADAVLADSEKPFLAVYILLDEKRSAYITPAQVDGLAHKALENEFVYKGQATLGDEIDDSNALKLLKNGLVKEKDIAQAFTSLAQEEGLFKYELWESSKLYQGILESAGKLDEIKQTIIKQVDSGKVNLYGLSCVSILSYEEKKATVEKIIVDDPSRLFNIDEGIKTAVKYVGPEKVKECFNTQREFLEPSTLINFIGDVSEETLSVEERQSILHEAITKDPSLGLSHSELVIKLFGQEEAKTIFNSCLEGIKPEDARYVLFGIGDWIDHIGADHDREKQIATDLLTKSKSLYFLTNSSDGGKKVRSLFSKEELLELAEKTMAEAEDTWTLIDKDTVNSMLTMFGADQVKSWVEQFLETRPEVAASLLEEGFFLFDKVQLRTMSLAIAANKTEDLFNRPLLAKKALRPEEFGNILDEMLADNPDVLASRLHSLYESRAIDKKTLDAYYEKLVKVNPATMYLEVQARDSGWSNNRILEAMRSQTDIQAFAPKWFKEFFANFDKSSESSRNILMSEAALLYKSVMQISQKAPELLENVAELGTSASSQFDVISRLAFISKHGSGTMLEQAKAVSSTQEVNDLVFQALEQVLGVSIADTARANVDESLEAIVTYVNGFVDSADHMKLMAALVSAEGPAAFRDFRLVANSQEELEKAKAQGLLPSALSLEQHQSWREDLMLKRQESLRASAEDVRQSLQGIIAENAEYIGMDLQALNGDASSLNVEIRELGQRLAELHKQLAPSSLLDDEERRQVQNTADQISQELTERQLIAAFKTLYSLKQEDILAGGPVDEKGKKTQSIPKILDKALKLASKFRPPQEVTLAIEHMRQAYESYEQATEEEREITVEDTIDLKTTLEIGAEPVGTCQNYATGAYRACLLGYTEPGIKIAAVRDGGTIVARAIMRLMESEDGTPSLHVETIYSQNPSSVITESVYQLADEKAKTMGSIPVFVSQVSQDANGQVSRTITTTPFALVPSKAAIRVRSIRAPFVYVDSLRGPERDGYILKNLVQLSTK